MKKVLLICYHFPPSASVGGQRAVRIARYLPEFGYNVEVLTTAIGDGETNFDQDLLKTVSPNIPIHRIPVRYFLRRNPWQVPSRKRPLHLAWWKLRAYIQYMMGYTDWYYFWAKDARKKAEALIREGEYRCILVSGPPFLPMVETIELKRQTGIPLVTDFRDIWVASSMSQESTTTSSLVRLRTHRLRKLECRIIEMSDKVILNHPEARDIYRQSYPDQPSSKFTFVTNAYEESCEEKPSEYAERSTQRRVVNIVHTGVLSYGRHIPTMLLMQAARELTAHPEKLKIELVFAGAGEDGMVGQIAEKAGADGITLDLGWVSHKKSIELQQKADVLLLLQPDKPNIRRLMLPAKLFEYMIARKPILGILPDGPAARIIRETNIGEIGLCNDITEIKSALKRIVARVESGQNHPHPPLEYSARETMHKLASILDEVLSLRCYS